MWINTLISGAGIRNLLLQGAGVRDDLPPEDGQKALPSKFFALPPVQNPSPSYIYLAVCPPA